jgi:3-oxoadipate enol-lactonase
VTDLEHRIDGPADAPVVVLSNALGAGVSMWEPQMAALAGRFRVVRYETRGHGGSPAPDGDLTIADLAADVLGLLDHLGVERASLAGVSLGGMTAMQVASTVPERVERLVLCCTAARIGTPEMWEERIRTVRESGTAALAEATMQRWFTPAADPATVARFAAVLSATPDKGYAACCAAIRDMDLGEQLASIQAPTLVIAGRHDGSTPPEQGEQIAARIPGARLLIVEHGAHMSNVERAGEVTPAMLEHLGGR